MTSAPSSLPPLTAVRVFEAAARHQSFTRAAGELGMTQAAVSYQIKVLEERVGQPLFLRAKGRVVLSDAGERLAGPVSRAFDDLRATFATVREEASGTLSISTVQTFATHWLVPRLGSFRAERPNLAVRLDTQPRLVDFAAEDVDVGIRSGTGPWPGLASHLLMRTTFTPMMAPSLIERLGRPDGPADLLRFPLIGVTDPWWLSWFRLAGVPEPTLSAQADVSLGSQQLEASAAMAGQGVAILTPGFFGEDLAAGRLVQPFDIVGDDGHSYWLVYPQARRHVPKIKAFRDWACRQARLAGVTG
ncbi:LysR substrate-binding domain-containing protein [uncultured Alsobacter sp.]|uniref:LysR substrate-binding domain-containing protein n=1 Tax=uncultured Alsobacter sp. TaxID=1748258 RepID=UPI0025F7BD68|nr:LysR substrate-binding domain-containing protein [uncultured Alsobacter sp.]